MTILLWLTLVVTNQSPPPRLRSPYTTAVSRAPSRGGWSSRKSRTRCASFWQGQRYYYAASTTLTAFLCIFSPNCVIILWTFQPNGKHFNQNLGKHFNQNLGKTFDCPAGLASWIARRGRCCCGSCRARSTGGARWRWRRRRCASSSSAARGRLRTSRCTRLSSGRAGCSPTCTTDWLTTIM